MNRYSTDNSKICIDFSRFNFCFRSVSVKDYTNKLKDFNQFFNKFKRIIENDIPFFSQYTFDEIKKKSGGHSHNIPTSSKEYLQVIEILKELYSSVNNNIINEKDFELFLINHINDYSVWQLGVSGGIRLIGTRNSNVSIFDTVETKVPVDNQSPTLMFWAVITPSIVALIA